MLYICFSLPDFKEWTFEENTEASHAQPMLVEDQKDGVMKTKMSRKEQTVSLVKSRAVRLTNLFSQAPFLEGTAVLLPDKQRSGQQCLNDRVIHKKNR